MRQYYRWDQILEDDDVAAISLDVALWEVQSIDCPCIRESLEGLLFSGDWLAIAKFPVDYTKLSMNDARHLRQVQALFSKRKDLDFGVDKAKVALDKFASAELLCKETNQVFRDRASGRFQFLPRVERVLWHASRKIFSILGPVPNLSELKLSFGPGATTQVSKREASSRAKLGLVPSCSVEMFPGHLAVLKEMPAWSDLFLCEGPHRVGTTPVLCQTGKVALVPKNATEDRSIVVEPTLNTCAQRGIGLFMKERLRRVGVDISDQTRNQRLACKGSINGELVTVDMQSASDTISIEVVYDLLGLEWATFLGRYRTGTVSLNGSSLKLEKFSSMGNGFTFPLETLIFYALAYGCCVELGLPVLDVAAYGDDIVIPVGGYKLLCEVFFACGFVVNRSKSFADGPFRESCGADYFQGTNIRPFYLRNKEGERLRVCHLFQMHNFYFRLGEKEVCEYLIAHLDPSIRLFGPDGYGDGHLLGQWAPRRKRSHSLRGFDGYLFDTFTWKSRRSFRVSRGDRVLPLYSTYLSERETERDISGWRVSELSREALELFNDVLLPKDTESSAVNYDRQGNLSVTVPGTCGVNRITIYTFTRN